MSYTIEFPCKVGEIIYYHFQYRYKRILPFTRKARVCKIWCSNREMNFSIEAEMLDAKDRPYEGDRKTSGVEGSEPR